MLLLALPGCSGDADPVELESCPAGDRAWQIALSRSRGAEQNAELATRADDLALSCAELWQPSWLGAELRYRLRQYEHSEERGRRALSRAREAGDPVGISRACSRLGWLIRRSGDLPGASERFTEAVEAARASARQDLLGHSLNGLAGVVWYQGDLARARELYAETVRSFDRAHLRRAARMARHNQARVLVALGDTTRAREVLERLYEVSGRDGDATLEAAAASGVGNVHRALRQYEDALAWYERAAASDDRTGTFAKLHKGRMEMILGRFEDAERTLAAVGAPGLPLFELSARGYRAELDLRRGELAGLPERLAPLIAEADARGFDVTGWHARWVAGKALLALGRKKEGIAQLEASVERIERHGRGLNLLEEGLGFHRTRIEPYVELAVALRDTPAELLQVLRQTHARGLRAALEGAESDGGALDLPALQRRLAPDEMLIDYLVGEERGVVLAVTRARSETHVLPGWEELSEPLYRYRAALQRPLRSADARLDPEGDLARSMEVGERLSRTLLEPFRPMLEKVRRLYVVPDRDLALLPLAALPWPDGETGEARFLVESFELATLPLEGPAPEWGDSRGPLILAGDPDADDAGRFPRLPGAADELRDIAGVWHAEEHFRLAGGELTKEALLGLPLDRVRTLHLSTHAIGSTSDRDACAVYLSQGEPLGLEAVAELPLDASPLVVLSACRTGEGELIPGQGLVGLGWAFLRAGARGVLASLWTTEDETTGEVMLAFHRELGAGRDPLAALAAAQRGRIAAGRHPAYWAPFTLLVKPQSPTD